MALFADTRNTRLIRLLCPSSLPNLHGRGLIIRLPALSSCHRISSDHCAEGTPCRPAQTSTVRGLGCERSIPKVLFICVHSQEQLTNSLTTTTFCTSCQISRTSFLAERVLDRQSAHEPSNQQATSSRRSGKLVHSIVA